MQSPTSSSTASRYSNWPYYLQPDGWIPKPDVPATHWTAFMPTEEWTATHSELFARLTGKPASEMILEVVNQDPIARPSSNPVPYYEMPPARSGSRRNGYVSGSRASGSSSRAGAGDDADANDEIVPSPFFARVPAAGRKDIDFCLYRYAQYAGDSDTDNPIAHPAFQCYEAMTGPDLIWDLTALLHFPYVALSNLIPLCPEEFDTYLTHPPLPTIEIRFDVLPLLSFVLPAAGGFGVTLRDFMQKVTHQLQRHFTVYEWNAQFTEDQRRQILCGYRRRTREEFDVARRTREIQFSGDMVAARREETVYLVSDMLAEEPMFLGIAMEDGDPEVWTVYTCGQGKCHGFPIR